MGKTINSNRKNHMSYIMERVSISGGEGFENQKEININFYR